MKEANTYIEKNLVALCEEIEAWNRKGVLPKKARHLRKVVSLLWKDMDKGQKYLIAEGLVRRHAVQYVIRTAKSIRQYSTYDDYL